MCWFSSFCKPGLAFYNSTHSSRSIFQYADSRYATVRSVYSDSTHWCVFTGWVLLERKSSERIRKFVIPKGMSTFLFFSCGRWRNGMQLALLYSFGSSFIPFHAANRPCRISNLNSTYSAYKPFRRRAHLSRTSLRCFSSTTLRRCAGRRDGSHGSCALQAGTAFGKILRCLAVHRAEKSQKIPAHAWHSWLFLRGQRRADPEKAGCTGPP